VVTIGAFNSGTASNVIPETAELMGTLRTFSPEVRGRAIERIEELARSIETGFGVRCRVEVIPGYPPCPTDPELSELLLDVAGELLGPGSASREPPSMGSEDFAFFCERVPGAVLRIGCKGSGPLHSPRFNPDEGAIEVGIKVVVGTLVRLLA
jgi:metal-dependent amidase/aminoacylase/carboxypeptidase family protein